MIRPKPNSVPTMFLLVFGPCGAVISGAEPERTAEQRPVTMAVDDVAALANRIDGHIEAVWRANGVLPAPIADDAEFLRRVSLDITGTIPSVWEVRSFLQDESPSKRRRIVDKLLESPAFYSHLASRWRAMLIPETTVDFRLQAQSTSFDLWLRQTLVEGNGYDQLVRDILKYPIDPNAAPSGAHLFYSAREAKPESLAAATTRRFLGIRLECAQCHDHPFSDWKQEDFWSQAAFFAGLQSRPNGQLAEDPTTRSIRVPGGDQLVEARFLGGQPSDFSETSEPRHALADWVTSSQNPYFARAAANQVWALLFGYGIVHPPDDFDEANPPSHPRLLDELGSALLTQGFDLRFLFRATVASRAYQRTSRQTDISQSDPRLFARHASRSLTADQLYDSLALATGHYSATSFRDRGRFGDLRRSRFRELFEGQVESPGESQVTILQSLAMMNGEFVQEVTDVQQGATLAGVLDASFLTDAERVRTLYLATLSREPRAEEVERSIEYLQAAESRAANAVGTNADAFADIFWALLNSSEFSVNH